MGKGIVMRESFDVDEKAQLVRWVESQEPYAQVKKTSGARKITHLLPTKSKSEKSSVKAVLKDVKKKIEGNQDNLSPEELTSIYRKCERIYRDTEHVMERDTPWHKISFGQALGRVKWFFSKYAIKDELAEIKKLSDKIISRSKKMPEAPRSVGKPIKGAPIRLLDRINEQPPHYQNVCKAVIQAIQTNPAEFATFRKRGGILGALTMKNGRFGKEMDLGEKPVFIMKGEPLVGLMAPTQTECEQNIIAALRGKPELFRGLQLKEGLILTVDTDDGRKWGIYSDDNKGNVLSFAQLDSKENPVKEALSKDKPVTTNFVQEQITSLIQEEHVQSIIKAIKKKHTVMDPLQAGRILTIDTDDGRKWGIDSSDSKGSRISFVLLNAEGNPIEKPVESDSLRNTIIAFPHRQEDYFG